MELVIVRSNAEAEYRSMTMVTCELMWIKQFLQELRFCEVVGDRERKLESVREMNHVCMY